MVLGLIYPDEGRILYNGKPYSNEQLSLLGYLPEERGLYPKVKVSDQIIYLSQLRGMSKADADRNLKQWLERFEVPEYYNKKVEELSKGNQQKIQFIAAVNHKPRIVVMDEAFSGLDPVNVELLKSTVKELRDSGSSILFSTHRMEHVEELCRNITILHRSNTVLKGSLKEIKNNSRENVSSLALTKKLVDSIGWRRNRSHAHGARLRYCHLLRSGGRRHSSFGDGAGERESFRNQGTDAK